MIEGEPAGTNGKLTPQEVFEVAKELATLQKLQVRDEQREHDTASGINNRLPHEDGMTTHCYIRLATSAARYELWPGSNTTHQGPLIIEGDFRGFENTATNPNSWRLRMLAHQGGWNCLVEVSNIQTIDQADSFAPDN